MDLKQVEVHNAVPERCEATGGWRLPRYPQTVREILNPRGRWIAAKAAGVEIRFACESPLVELTVSNPGDDASLVVRHGSFWAARLQVPTGQTRTFQVPRPDTFKNVAPDALRTGGWSEAVCRIQWDGSDIVLHHLEASGSPLRTPRKDEKPVHRWLAYGSSITHADLQGYAHVAAQLANLDVFNKGLSGSCHMEPDSVDWLAGLEFDIATFEIGINMRNAFEPDEFERRTRHLLRTMRAAKPDTPLVFISHFLNKDHHVSGDLPEAARRQIAFDNILRELYSEAQDPNLHLLEGTQLLREYQLLAADGIHPTWEGQAIMGMRIAAELKAILQNHHAED